MLHDLDLSVMAFLSRLLPAGTAIRFGPPAASWAQTPPGVPLLSAFLYDICQAQVMADGTLAKDGNGHATAWHPPVRRYRVSYLLTAWTERGPGPGGQQPSADGAYATSTPTEHELLGLVLVGCASGDAIPDECLRGVLAGTGEPVLLACGSQDRAIGPAQLWSALGVPARTALDLMVVAPVVSPYLEVAAAADSLEVGMRRKHAPLPSADGERPRPRSHITEG